MFVDIWILSIFAVLFGTCAGWSRYTGYRSGVKDTIQHMINDRFISIVNNRVVAYRKESSPLI